MALSIVIPSYNSAAWLPSTLRELDRSIQRSNLDVEVIVVDDGSTDDTLSVLEAARSGFPYPLRVLKQENKGRFLARWAGVGAARYEWVFILDSRVLVHEGALEYLGSALPSDTVVEAWNGHVITDPTAPLVGRFWEVPTFMFWASYLGNPRPMLITPENFDRIPKGTGCFVVRKKLYVDACLAAWPTENAHLVSDDTKILRYIVGKAPIRIDPGFSATYRPRLTYKAFLTHSRMRGTLFVDSYAGTSVTRDIVLILLVALPPLLASAMLMLVILNLWATLILVVGAASVCLLVPPAIASVRGCPRRASLSYLLFVVPFGVTFWAGLLRGLAVHRKSFQFRKQSTNGAQP
ncbi:glycosyltransferase family 2 protein [Cryobacterium algoritolerans]|uniref:Glycosyltransferase family 2 protein n=1 Tax=Cryobacterium algoritolerans TaxID=1259184 RepID=A0A4R8WVV7_9MICO|nr:glycosyltransferase family 2 protein [Cryobacterium algoritolerans]